AGMGSIGGVFLPSDGQAWPEVDRSLELYQLDLRHYYRQLMGTLDELRATVAAEAPGNG
ncbi:MAG: hypothetical protein HKO53_13850, partial [Gemmatimonadetes bacterium]|nr:hypothetical protein [Gemmatimonadota bacterium]